MSYTNKELLLTTLREHAHDEGWILDEDSIANLIIPVKDNEGFRSNLFFPIAFLLEK